LANSKQAVICILLKSGFHLATLPQRPDWWSAAEMVILLDGSPISKEELWGIVCRLMMEKKDLINFRKSW
jgi:hypothetical protein